MPNTAELPKLIVLDPCLTTPGVERLRALIEGFGAYPMYVEAPIADGIGAGLVRRHDALMHYIKGVFAQGQASLATIAARINLFRGALAEGQTVHRPESRSLLYDHPPFIEAARALTGLPVVVPDMLYVNVLLPGQELAIHTDTPEYRGLSKANTPEWLLVAMHHSGLFERWRVPIAGGVTFIDPPKVGGAFVVYPDGPEGPMKRLGLVHDTAVMLNADALFHGVERVGGPDAPPPPAQPGMSLHPLGDGRWAVRDGERPVVEYAPGEVRLSVQWKAHCFADEADRARFAERRDDLTQAGAVDMLVEDLRARGALTGERPKGPPLALMLMETYIPFPGHVAPEA